MSDMARQLEGSFHPDPALLSLGRRSTGEFSKPQWPARPGATVTHFVSRTHVHQAHLARPRALTCCPCVSPLVCAARSLCDGERNNSLRRVSSKEEKRSVQAHPL